MHLSDIRSKPDGTHRRSQTSGPNTQPWSSSSVNRDSRGYWLNESQKKHLSNISRLTKRTAEAKADRLSTSETAEQLAEEYNRLWKTFRERGTPRRVQQEIWYKNFDNCWQNDRGLERAFHAELGKQKAKPYPKFLPYDEYESEAPTFGGQKSFTMRKDRSRSRSPIDSTGRLSGTSSLRGDVYRTSRRKHRGRGEIYYSDPNSAESFPPTADEGRLGLVSPVQSADEGELLEGDTYI